MKIKEYDFDRGVVYACARLIELFDQPSMAKTILRESGVNITKADAYDVKFITQAQNNKEER